MHSRQPHRSLSLVLNWRICSAYRIRRKVSLTRSTSYSLKSMRVNSGMLCLAWAAVYSYLRYEYVLSQAAKWSHASNRFYVNFLQQIKEIKVNDETKTGQCIKKGLWYVSISRNALIVMITSIIGYNWTSSHSPPFKLSGSYSNHRLCRHPFD